MDSRTAREPACRSAGATVQGVTQGARLQECGGDSAEGVTHEGKQAADGQQLQ